MRVYRPFFLLVLCRLFCRLFVSHLLPFYRSLSLFCHLLSLLCHFFVGLFLRLFVSHLSPFYRSLSLFCQLLSLLCHFFVTSLSLLCRPLSRPLFQPFVSFLSFFVTFLSALCQLFVRFSRAWSSQCLGRKRLVRSVPRQ